MGERPSTASNHGTVNQNVNGRTNANERASACRSAVSPSASVRPAPFSSSSGSGGGRHFLALRMVGRLHRYWQDIIRRGREGGREAGGRAAVSTLGNAIPRGERGDGRGRQGRESRNHNHVLLQKLVRSSVQENLVSILFSRKIIMYSNHKRKLSKG